MTKKDYVLIATVLKELRPEIEPDETADPSFERGWQTALDDVCDAFARKLQIENPRFDSAKFLAACGVKV